MVDLTVLRGKIYKGKDEIKLVTAQGWEDWYPALPGEFKQKFTQHGLFQDEEK